MSECVGWLGGVGYTKIWRSNTLSRLRSEASTISTTSSGCRYHSSRLGSAVHTCSSCWCCAHDTTAVAADVELCLTVCCVMSHCAVSHCALRCVSLCAALCLTVCFRIRFRLWRNRSRPQSTPRSIPQQLPRLSCTSPCHCSLPMYAPDVCFTCSLAPFACGCL